MTSRKAAGRATVIKDATEATFMADVIEASQDGAGDRRFLGDLVRAVQDADAAAGGGRDGGEAARCGMVKVDVDQNQSIAAQLRIQSIPTVYAFWQGQPVDGFQGAVPGSEVKKFIERVIARWPATAGWPRRWRRPRRCWPKAPRWMRPKPLPRSWAKSRRMPRPMAG